MTGGYIFSLCVSPHGGVPHPADGGGGVPPSAVQAGGTPSSYQGGTPSSWWGGVPPYQVQVGGYPIQLIWVGYPIQLMGGGTLAGGTPPPHQSSIACTCYAAGGMPLAFTQEDFLVHINWGKYRWNIADDKWNISKCHKDKFYVVF